MKQRGRANYWLASAAIVAVMGCAHATQPASVSEPVASTEVSGDAQLLRMTDVRLLDTVLVDALLRDGTAAQRARVALAIGQVKGHARYGRLRQLLVDGDTAVAANAAFALGIVRDTTAIVSLGRAVAGAPDPVAIEAAWSLGDIGDGSRSMLMVALGDGQDQPLVTSSAAQRSPGVRAALILALAKLRAVPTTVLLPWLQDRDTSVVRATAYVLGRTRAPAGIRALLAFRQYGDEEVRQHVARALSKNATGDSLATRGMEALTALMADPSARVRVNAVRSLATFGAPSRETVQRALRDADGNVRVATSQVIGPLFGSDANAWRAAWAADTLLPVRQALMTGARLAGSDALATGEAAWMKSKDWRQRAAVLAARGGDTMHPPRLVTVGWGLNDADARVKDAAIGALRPVLRANDAGADSARRLLKPMVSDPDMQVRVSVLAALSNRATVADVPMALDAYAFAHSDRSNDARLAALGLISALWQRDSTQFDATFRQRLRALNIPHDSAERVALVPIEGLPPLNAMRPSAPARPMAEYEALVRRYVVAGAKPSQAVLHTVHGDITIALLGKTAPLTVDNFVQLAKRGEYRGTNFHRVVPNFVAQDGDARGDGNGSPGYSIRDELNRQRHMRGTVAMALSGPDTGGSQYYLCHSPQPHLDGHYTVFGQIVQGWDVLDRIVQGDGIVNIEIR